jgi:hypothetical protein
MGSRRNCFIGTVIQTEASVRRPPDDVLSASSSEDSDTAEEQAANAAGQRAPAG